VNCGSSDEIAAHRRTNGGSVSRVLNIISKENISWRKRQKRGVWWKKTAAAKEYGQTQRSISNIRREWKWQNMKRKVRLNNDAVRGTSAASRLHSISTP